MILKLSNQSICNDTSRCIALGEILGKGSFAKVHLASYVRTKQRPLPHKMVETFTIPCQRPTKTSHFALKCIDKRLVEKEGALDSIDREIAILSKCSHLPWVASLLFSHDTLNVYYIGMELCPGGDLHTILSTNGVTYDIALRYLMEIAVALAHLHRLDIIFHDLKPENICIDQYDRVKLVDFGLATLLDAELDNNLTTSSLKRRETICNGGTLGYCSPEILKRESHAYESDWWSYGVVAYELLSGELPFYVEGCTPMEHCQMICSDTNTFRRNEYIRPDSIEELFLSQLLDKNPVSRFGYHGVAIESLLCHQIFVCAAASLTLSRNFLEMEKDIYSSSDAAIHMNYGL